MFENSVASFSSVLFSLRLIGSVILWGTERAILRTRRVSLHRLVDQWEGGSFEVETAKRAVLSDVQTSSWDPKDPGRKLVNRKLEFSLR